MFHDLFNNVRDILEVYGQVLTFVFAKGCDDYTQILGLFKFKRILSDFDSSHLIRSNSTN